MSNGEYWQKRFELLEHSQHDMGVQCYANIEKQYRQAQKTLEGQIAAWYQRFATNNGYNHNGGIRFPVLLRTNASDPCSRQNEVRCVRHPGKLHTKIEKRNPECSPPLRLQLK